MYFILCKNSIGLLVSNILKNIPQTSSARYDKLYYNTENIGPIEIFISNWSMCFTFLH